MSAEIIALRCPSCGSAETVDSRVAHFGYEFTCSHCRTTSVLVINSKLYIRSPGEHVCTACGRVAAPTARYCQCGSSLVTQCHRCLAEFPADHGLCDACGWPVGTDPSSPAGHALRVKRGIKDLSNHDHDVVVGALYELSHSITPTPEAAEAIWAYLIALPAKNYDTLRDQVLSYLGNMRDVAVQAIIKASQSDSCDELLVIRALTQALGRGATSAAEPLFAALIRNTRSKDPSIELLRLFSLCGPRAVTVLIEFLAGAPAVSDVAAAGLERIGQPALPQLRRLTGLFADRRMKEKARCIISRIEQATCR